MCGAAAWTTVRTAGDPIAAGVNGHHAVRRDEATNADDEHLVPQWRQQRQKLRRQQRQNAHDEDQCMGS